MQAEEFSNNTGASRYELSVEGKVAAFASYEKDGGAIRFTHTEVQPQYEGQGLASRLAQHALDDVRKQGLRAVPDCAFIARYIERHPEYAPLVEAG